MNINDINEELLDEIFSKELVVYEDVKGTTIFVRWDGEDFLIKSDNLNSDPINFIDGSIDNFYGKAFAHFNSLNDRVKGLMPKKWWFSCEYFPEEANIYSKNPKNDLVLTSIVKNNKSDYTVEEIEEYSRLMEIECLPFIFKGILNEKAIEAIKYFLNTSEDDLEYIFGERSFAFFFYKLLNPQISQSFLMENDFNSNVKKLVIKLDDGETRFDLLNPLYNRISNQNKTEYLEIYSLILINFLNFCQSVNFDTMKMKGEKREEVYTNMMCTLFNIYVTEVKDNILKWDFIVPEFFNKDKFRINKEILLNRATKGFIKEEKIDYIFKCIYFSFKQEFDKPFGIFTKNGIELFNNFVKFLRKRIDEYFNKKSEEELQKRGLVDFGDFFDIKYDQDGEDKVYPNVLDEIERGESKKKKKMYGKEDIGQEKTPIK